ncbi:MAG: hypothetical protein Q7W13_09535 [Bacteroidia bacterium]|jgi:hypothetical protein|nr:hypothetical protein [Bacteroidia bacterium]
MDAGIFLTIKDLMKLLGSNNYSSCANQHKVIRDSIATGKKKLTIQEYCDYEKIGFDFVWKFIRG